MTPLLLLAALAAPTTEIKVDQVGYLPDAPKVAFVVSKTKAATFTVRRAGETGIAFQGKLTTAVSDPDSGDAVQAADFTALTKSGTYYRRGAGRGPELGLRDRSGTSSCAPSPWPCARSTASAAAPRSTSAPSSRATPMPPVTSKGPTTRPPARAAPAHPRAAGTTPETTAATW